MHVRELPWLEPFSAVRRLSDRPHLTFLDSAAPHGGLGRYSYLACDPFAVFTVLDGHAHIDDAPVDGDPWQVLRRLLGQHAQDRREDLPPFQGGAAGYLGYDLNRTLERLPPPSGGMALPEALLPLYDVVVAWDHDARRVWIVSSGWPEPESAIRQARGVQRAEWMLALLGRPAPDLPDNPSIGGAWRSNFSRERYKEAVSRVVELILRGDIFQANIAQRFSAELPEAFDPLEFYARLRAVNPAPFAAFLRHGGLSIASSSPERFVRLDRRTVETRPIKGTIARCTDPDEDAARAQALLSSEKDRAENTMIVDLLRNDLSRVCAPHSVAVGTLCGLESYAGLHHLVSVVTGSLEAGQDAVALLRACFPGGSITGAPKKRAMEIIAETEFVARQVYCGAIAWLGFDGGMDSNIAIRTVTFADGMASLHAGGGITALSDPDAEYEETLAKASRIFAAFGDGAAGR
jgi:para-aminobenzoate synthetase component 1